MDLANLKALIAATPECAGKSLQEIADILNAPADSRVTSPDIPRRTVLRVFAARGIISKLYDAARDTGRTHQIRSICFAAEFILSAGADGLDMSDPATAQMINALKLAGIITQQDQDALTAATLVRGSLAQNAGLTFVHAGHVSDAQALK